VAAPDWSSSFLAVYLFEPDAPLGGDASGNGPELAPVMSPDRTDDAMQGATALVADGTSYLTSPSPAFEPEPTQALTIGGWFRVGGSTDRALLIDKGDGTPEGYRLARTPAQALVCAGGGQDSDTADGTWPDDTWRHAVCRFDPVSGDMDGFLDGVEALVNTDNLAWNVATDPLSVGGPGSPFAGQLDEVFFIDAWLEPSSLRRIHACGIDGLLCRCDASEPTEYVSCGRQADAGCIGLPDCDQAGP
ncbi:MAG: LamG domain-containing protein, partial [Polyangiaceae bacterium]